MWSRVGAPDFVLPPKHASIFLDSLRYLSDVIGWEDCQGESWESGISVFDRLTQGQRQVALLQVGQALLQSSASPPAVTAYRAAAVAAIYRTLLDLIQLDIETDNSRTDLRTGTLAALDEMDYWQHVNDARPSSEEPEDRPADDCTDEQVWTALVDALCMEVLEDYDFDMDREFLDLDPQAGTAMKQWLNIDPDYFTDIPEDPSRERLMAVKHELHGLTAK